MIIAKLIFKDLNVCFEEHKIIKLDMTILHLIRLVMYINCKSYKDEYRNKLFSVKGHVFWL